MKSISGFKYIRAFGEENNRPAVPVAIKHRTREDGLQFVSDTLYGNTVLEVVFKA